MNLHLVISLSDQAVTGPFVFDFEIPSYGGNVIHVGQTVEAAGVTVALEKIIVSPWDTRAIMLFDPPADERGSYAIPITTIQLPDSSSIKSNLGIGNNPGEALQTEYFKGDLTSQTGKWALTVKELVYPPTSNSDDNIRITGPWVFTFQVP